MAEITQTKEWTELVRTLRSAKVDLSTEYGMQEGLADKFSSFSIEREVRLSSRDIIDFVVKFDSFNVGIECKIGGQPLAVNRQIERYSNFEMIDAIILYTNKHMGAPASYNNKPVLVIKAGLAWI